VRGDGLVPQVSLSAVNSRGQGSTCLKAVYGGRESFDKLVNKSQNFSKLELTQSNNSHISNRNPHLMHALNSAVMIKSQTLIFENPNLPKPYSFSSIGGFIWWLD